MKEYFMLAVGNLAHRKTRSILTMVGIFIGIAAVISLISLGQGLQTAVTAQFSALGSDRLIIQAKGGLFGPPGQNTAVSLGKDDLRVVQRSQYVKVAAGRLLKQAQVSFNDVERVIILASFPDEDQEERELVKDVSKPVIAQGRFLEIGDRNKIVIGSRWAQDNAFDRPMRVGDKLVINGERVEVIGILAAGGNPGLDRALWMNEDPMRAIVDEPDEYSVITARADSDAVVELAVNAVTRDLRRERDVKERQEDFTVQTSAQLLQSVQSILTVIQGVLVGIAAISLIVGGIGIMNTMYTSVLERTREIGIMKSIGATQRIILSIFLAEAGVLGLIGGAIGIALGVGLSKLVELIGTQALGPGLLQTQISWWLVLGALLFSLVIGIVSGLLPAIQASRMEPVEALNA
jgi:putative ABC transport system permease protein